METSLEVVAFSVAGTRIALPVEVVAEVLPAVSLTALPDAPAVVEGVFNLRGRVVPVVDIRARFGLPQRDLQPEDVLLVAKRGAGEVAIRADTADGLLTVEADSVMSAQELPDVSKRFLGVAMLPGSMVFIQDIEAFLGADEEALVEEAVSRYRESSQPSVSGDNP